MTINKKKKIPICKKENLTIYEAGELTGIGRDKLRAIAKSKKCDFALWYGTKTFFKRRELEKFLDNTYSL